MEFQEVVYGGMDWIDLAQYRYKQEVDADHLHPSSVQWRISGALPLVALLAFIALKAKV
jgi:hypothetical protein